MKSSTVRSSRDSSFTKRDGEAAEALSALRPERCRSENSDLVLSLRRDPELLRQKSLLKSLAVKEFRALKAGVSPPGVDLFCQQFQEFGGSIQYFIKRELEVQNYFDEHPELIDAISDQWPVIGDQFGEFQIIEELGCGGCAHVYLSRQPDLGNREVVLKVTRNLGFEATILGRLDHPNIVPIHSIGFDPVSELHYLCMPYCGRSTLLDLLETAFAGGYPRSDTCMLVSANRWSYDEPTRANRRHGFATTYIDALLGLFIRIAAGLEHAHEREILHGDLKPSNILLSPDGRPLLLDFNLSKDYARSLNTCGGTLPYMPPEYLAAFLQPDRLAVSPHFDPSPDIYSFGAVLYELLTGEPRVGQLATHESTNSVAESLLEVLQHELPSVRARNPLVNRSLESVVRKCLAFRSEDRYQSIGEVRRHLARERRSLAFFTRFARVRPVASAVALGIPLLVLTATAAHVAMKPPLFQAEFDEGIRLSHQGQPKEAVAHFIASAEANPKYLPARFNLGLSRLAVGQLDSAIEDFGQLAEEQGDVPSMAYVGYVFNLKGVPLAAIPCYELAIKNGDSTLATLNNLGASLISTQTQDSTSERYRRAQAYLDRAIELDPTCEVARLNALRLAIVRSNGPGVFNVERGLADAEALLDRAQRDDYVKAQIAEWYYRARKTHSVTLRPDPRWQSIVEAADRFETLMANLSAGNVQARDFSEVNRSWNSGSGRAIARRFYIEPVLREERR